MHVVLEVERDGFDSMRNMNDADLIHLSDVPIEVGALRHGMASGRPSAAFCFKLPDGKVVLAETSLALFLTAADMLKARYGDPR